jgi:hypothetical protein
MRNELQGQVPSLNEIYYNERDESISTWTPHIQGLLSSDYTLIGPIPDADKGPPFSAAGRYTSPSLVYWCTATSETSLLGERDLIAILQI